LIACFQGRVAAAISSPVAFQIRPPSERVPKAQDGWQNDDDMSIKEVGPLANGKGTCMPRQAVDQHKWATLPMHDVCWLALPTMMLTAVHIQGVLEGRMNMYHQFRQTVQCIIIIILPRTTDGHAIETSSSAMHDSIKRGLTSMVTFTPSCRASYLLIINSCTQSIFVNGPEIIRLLQPNCGNLAQPSNSCFTEQ
jgi:hypothetical protein